MTERYWNKITAELLAGTRESDHPFRYATLATVGLEQVPRLRTVVIREFDPEEVQLIFYTDSRSKKMLHIKENNKVSLLFYHPEKLLQLRMEGIAMKERDGGTLARHWSGIKPESRKDYTVSQTPGTEIKGPDQLEYVERDDFFTVINVHPFRIEYLQLKRPNHIRVRFSKDADNWRSEFLVP
ncbi:pyridoxamine 5'-phosphate oxidase family protein [Robiginitalea sp. SC105]|uniref:pyridoxamine 5'-phosphate oxidase family protein n=1 Tax=Robiginitalea sp. SC105 TaxID=2762332 RepID=UPI00163B00F6|nr:pyridoxamine 5'-phosphate oxidase family protein [Robiginitalea sp. SC105]MBC2840158.1 pyridoxamine 5'-phosphate oxidase family protein [Robiginitalea sp. SC105]